MKFVLDAFRKINPDATGPMTVEESVKLQLKVIAALDAKTSGQFLSQNGDKHLI
jgi:hypothetical protein